LICHCNILLPLSCIRVIWQWRMSWCWGVIQGHRKSSNGIFW